MARGSFFTVEDTSLTGPGSAVTDRQDIERAGERIDGTGYRRGLSPNIRFSVGRLPSLADSDSDAVAEDYLDGLESGHRARAERLAATDPMAAGIALADLDSMRDGYRELVAAGYDRKTAAHAVGNAGAVFGSYANASANAGYLMRFAETRGVDMPTAARELVQAKDNYRAQFLQKYGFPADATPDASVEENIRSDFSQLLGAVRDIEDRYGWQFDHSTYRDVMSRMASLAADLAVSRVSVGDVGANVIAESALMANGALRGDPNANTVSRLLIAQAGDRSRIRVFGNEGDDMYSNPYRSGPVNGVDSKTGALEDSLDYGLARDLRQAMFDHRARSVRSGRAPEDFSDSYALRRDIVDSFRRQSTSSSGVSDDTFMKLAGSIVDRLSNPDDGEPVSVIGAARDLASGGSVAPDQVAALGRWAKALTMDSKEGQQRLAALATQYIQKFTAGAKLSTRDPLVTNFSSQVYRLLRRRYQSLAVSAGLDGIDQMMAVDPNLFYREIESELSGFTKSLEGAQKAQDEAVRRRARAAAQGREDAE